MAFINISNHPSKNWSDDQIDMATQMTRDSEIVDIPFPQVSAERNQAYIISLGYEVSDTIEQMLGDLQGRLDAIMVQGEMTLTHRLILQLQKDYPGVPVVAACSERVVETHHTGGDTVKTSVFKFVQFREYV